MDLRRAVAPSLQFLLFLTVFVMSTTFRQREYGSDSLDAQVLFRLGVLFASFSTCLLLYKSWIHRIFQPDMLPLTALIGLSVISCLYAPSLSYSFGAVFSIITAFLLFLTCFPILGESKTIQTLIFTITFICAASLVVYVLIPDMGHMKEWQGNVEVPGPRLSGIMGTANAVGFFAAAGLLLLYLCYNFNISIPKPFYFFSSTICGVALVMSESRTSMIAMILAMALVFFRKMTPARLAFGLFSAAFLVLGAMLIDTEALFSALSRSGDAQEIATGTGRLHIWQLVIQLIGQRPFTGWGYACSSFILPEHTAEIGHTPPHSHNIFLQLAFFMGLLGPLLYLLLLLLQTIKAIRADSFFKIALLLFMFIIGLTESSSFVGVANSNTIILATAIAMGYIRAHATNNSSHQ